MMKEQNDQYKDIIGLPYPQIKKHKPMPLRDRAAQFAPFAALTGYEAAIDETARRTDKKLEPDEDAVEILNRRIQMLQENICQNPEVEIMYFVPDLRKSGGAYAALKGNVRRIDGYARQMIFTNGVRIPLDDIYQIDGALFDAGNIEE